MIEALLSRFASFHYGDLFTTVPGITVAVVGTIAAILTAVFGASKKFQLPSETAPGLSRGFLNFILFIPFVLCFVLITPENAVLALLIALIGIPLAGAAMFAYGNVLANHRYTRPVPRGWLFWKRVGEEVIVGGTILTPDAQAKTGSITLQDMLASAEYKPDEIWERRSRTGIQQRIEFFYYLFFLCAVTTVSAGALATQALVTKEAPLVRAQTIWQQAHPATPPAGTP